MSVQAELDDSLFYSDVAINESTEIFINPLKEYAIHNSKQVYILKKALGANRDYSYSLADVAIIVSPGHSIMILNYGEPDDDALEDFRLDLLEDLGYLADKYHYNKILGRVRKWPQEYVVLKNIADFSVEEYIKNVLDKQFQRKVDLLISLLIGSINSIEKIGLEDPETLLEKVKQKIILFDGQQSRFIYQPLEQDTIVIQGMAGTGKTELLLHKIKDVYSTEKDAVIAFTCFNKVLANDMKLRIPQFFNFMKVEEQIEWNKRLHVFSSWGSANDPNSGLYSFVCSKYRLPFSTYGANPNFNELCRSCLSELDKQENFTPCFDYIFIDESQDFKDGFVELCKKITRKTVYIAGDIFQNIYDTSVNTNIKPDFLLNKCYRTDPKTLMFAHAVGMGLYETPQLNWLDDNGWLSCGYTLKKEEDTQTVKLSRNPLRRFEDLNATNTIRLHSCDELSYSSKIIDAVEEIRKENPSVEPEDIAVIILGNYKKLCTIADETSLALQWKFGWAATKGYETKEKSCDKVYISNVNNIKGLEFPFVICLVPASVSSNILVRNSIYMALTRSFLPSYFIVDQCNQDFIDVYSSAIEQIAEEGYMKVHEPTQEERDEMVTKIQISLAKKRNRISNL